MVQCVLRTHQKYVIEFAHSGILANSFELEFFNYSQRSIMINRKISLLVALSILTFGCALDEAQKYGEQCEGAKYYSDAAGFQQSFEDITNQYYEQYQKNAYCPADYPLCSIDADKATFCHTGCNGDYIYCKKGCIDPLTDDNHCGASGLCNNNTLGSENYIGKECNDDQKCTNGKCECPVDKTVVCNKVCVNPNEDVKHCGAKGQCNNSTRESNDFEGTACKKDQYCEGGECKCSDSNLVICDNDCINPEIDLNHCGAKGHCNDSAQGSENFVGEVCELGYICSAGKCEFKCPDNWHANQSNNDCELDNIENCGKIGIKCEEGTVCLLGKCAPNCDKYTTCLDDNKNEICIDPMSDSKFCGADSKCLGHTECKESEACVEGKCVCKADHHQYESDNDVFCEFNDNLNCGAHGVVCDISKVEHSKITECNATSAKCEATLCDDGYHIYNGQCEMDDNSNCGEHEKTCSKADVKGSEAVSCDKGQCIPLECDSEHILQASTCMEIDCQDDQTKCANTDEGGAIYRCSNKEWIKERDCDNNNSCNIDKTDCGNCKNDATTCTNTPSALGRMRICTNGEWGKVVSCTPHSCDPESNSCGVCKNDVDTKCINDENDIGYIAICKEGKWFKDETTIDIKEPDDQITSVMKSSCFNVSCKLNDKGESVCGECKNTTTAICKNDENRKGQMITCIDGKISSTVCDKGYSCDSTGLACGSCTNSVLSCKTNNGIGQLSICDYGVDTIVENCPGNTKCKNNSECEPCAEGNKFFIGSDGVSCVTYTQLVANPSVGNTIYFGQYQKMNDVGDKHPIEWKILKVEDNRILLITQYVIDAIPYHTKPESGSSSAQLNATWKESTLRSWLNGYGASNNNASIDYAKDNFINTAFSNEERKHIKSVTVSNADKDIGGEDTTDKIFLLSLSEVNSYFKDEDARKAIPTTYAKNVKNAYIDPKCTDGDNCPTLWLLRTPGKSLLQASYVYFTGEIDSDIGIGVSENGIGLRPAIWIGK